MFKFHYGDVCRTPTVHESVAVTIDAPVEVTYHVVEGIAPFASTRLAMGDLDKVEPYDKYEPDKRHKKFPPSTLPEQYKPQHKDLASVKWDLDEKGYSVTSITEVPRMAWMHKGYPMVEEKFEFKCDERSGGSSELTVKMTRTRGPFYHNYPVKAFLLCQMTPCIWPVVFLCGLGYCTCQPQCKAKVQKTEKREIELHVSQIVKSVKEFAGSLASAGPVKQEMVDVKDVFGFKPKRRLSANTSSPREDANLVTPAVLNTT